MSKKRIVVLSGAGVSAESGIATFRGSDGLWENHRIEDVASPEGWARDPDLVTRFYNLRRKAALTAQPNAAHIGLAALESDFDVYIITQNVDDLHERAGSSQVLHLHGELFKMRCESDPSDIHEIYGDIEPDMLSKKGKRMRPHIVWFGEMVETIGEAAAITETADIFVVVGTSLNVYPAAGLIHALPAHAKVYIIDTNIPYVSASTQITAIEKPATEGVKELTELLKSE